MSNARQGEAAASPLTVILTLAVVVAGLTALLFFTFVDVAGPDVKLQQVDAGGVVAFQVSAVHGKMDWNDLQVRFLTPGGADRAAFYLEVPSGPVKVGDQIHLRAAPPAGTYLLEVAKGTAFAERLAASF